ncbi:MAG: hypothetical protein SFU25_09730 [Candidatus Caenarcaniphilales bacterium]|nr:hypothetical protein [Candidatus Caenarcaniphilales bacterium]
MLLSSCSHAKLETVIEKKEAQEKKVIEKSDLPLQNLVLKTALNEEEKAFIKERAKGFDERVKQYAINYGPKSTPEDSKRKSGDMCKWIVNNVAELSKQPVSKDREREREREAWFYYNNCEMEITGKLNYQTSDEYWKLIEKKIPDSSQPLIRKTVDVLSKDFREGKYQPSLEHYLKLKEAIAKDPEDLLAFDKLTNWYQTGLRDKTGKDLIQEDYKEYCRKAVELKQWDHIYYLSKADSGAATKGLHYIEKCLETKPNEYDYNYCKCPEATRMVVGQWPKDALYDGYILDPSGEDGNGDLREGAKDYMNKLIKKHFGRDLTKEK